MRRSRMRCLRFEHRSNTRRTGYRSKAGSETRTMAVSLGRSDVPGAQYGVLTESPGSRDVSGSVLAPKPTKKSTVAGGLDASLRRYFWRLYRQRNLWPAKSGRKYAFPGYLCRNNAQKTPILCKRNLWSPKSFWRRLWRPSKHVITCKRNLWRAKNSVRFLVHQ